MAKMFYSSEEVQEKLGLTSDQIKQLITDGKLREFRDGAKIMFKVDEVDKLDPNNLVAEADDDSAVDLGADSGLGTLGEDSGIGDLGEDSGLGALGEDSGEEIAMTDMDAHLGQEEETPEQEELDDQIDISPAATGSSIGLLPMDSGSAIGLVPGDSADHVSLEDTSPGAADDNKDDTVITKLGDKAIDDASGSGTGLADPLATQLTSDFDDQVPLDSGGSGSGLLDLSREADDTSLGAELLEEIYPSADEGAVETQLPTQVDVAPEPEQIESMEAQAPMMEHIKVVQFHDPTSGVWGAMMIVPFAVLVYLAFAACSALAGVQSSVLTALSGKIWFVMGGAGVLAVLILLVGNLMTNQSGQPKAPKAKKPAAKKPKTKKKK